jgi:hypothetical protein
VTNRVELRVREPLWIREHGEEQPPERVVVQKLHPGQGRREVRDEAFEPANLQVRGDAVRAGEPEPEVRLHVLVRDDERNGIERTAPHVVAPDLVREGDE